MLTTRPKLPLAPGRWTLDPAHSSIEFTLGHLAFAKIRGRFHTFDAYLVVGRSLSTTSVHASIDPTSANTDNVHRDAQKRHVSALTAVVADTHMRFTSTNITVLGRHRYHLTGDLSINRVTRPVTLTVSFNGAETHRTDGSAHAQFEATGTISRKDYGLTLNVPRAVDRFVIADRVGIDLNIELQGPTS